MPPDPFTDADVIHAYSRNEAIRDGMLKAVPDAVASEAGFKVPVALTVDAWTTAVTMTEASKAAGCDEAGRLWDVLWMLRVQIAVADLDTDRIQFQVLVIGDRAKADPVDLVAHIGPGDDAAPVMTIMCPGED